MHPWMPFITEELWHLIAERETKDCIIVSTWPQQQKFDTSVLNRFTVFADVVMNIRNIRASKNISPKEALSLSVKTAETNYDKSFDSIINKVTNISSILVLYFTIE